MAFTAPCNAKAFPDDAPLLARMGSLEVRLATSDEEKRAAWALRHAVFVAERGLALHPAGLETDRFDPFCDHVIVRDLAHRGPGGLPPVVGTYRALRPERAVEGFYADAEFDLAPLFARHGGLRFCEVGRSCVAPSHRTKRTLEALWRGLFVYARRHGIDVYFGAASFPGTDPAPHAMALSWLCHNAAHPHWSAPARPAGAVVMDRIAPAAIDARAALRDMPPLLRGYLRIGAHVGRTAYIDPVFSTIDVLVLAPLANAPILWRRRFETLTGEGFDNRRAPVGIAPDML